MAAIANERVDGLTQAGRLYENETSTHLETIRELLKQLAASLPVAEEAGHLLEQMVPNIAKTADLVEEITAASGEQSAGIGQINESMGQLDKATQQNASASEELAATAEELNGQAEELQQAVAFFRLSEKSAAAPTARAFSESVSKAPTTAGLVSAATVADDQDFERF